jgi:hypothetical protein
MNNVNLRAHEWKNSDIQVFWGEIAPCEHLIQIYDTDKIFLSTLEGFAGGGLLSGDNVIIIATHEHLAELNARLINQNFDVDALIKEGRYFPLEASEILSKFMINNWPDELLFEQYISQLIDRASKDGKKVRAFGEMVALLWQQGHSGATVKLEHLWCKFHHKNNFTLYCAYPSNGFTQNANDSIDTICKAHSKIINGQAGPRTEIYYRTVDETENTVGSQP